MISARARMLMARNEERERVMVRNALQMHELIEAWKQSPEGRRKLAAYRRSIWDHVSVIDQARE